MKGNEFEQAWFGSFRVNGELCTADSPGYYNRKDRLLFGDTVNRESSIPWVRIGEKWIAGTVVLINVSWRQLDNESYVSGRPIWIDGKPFFCRCPELSSTNGANEWEKAIQITGADNDLWRWKGHFFFGNEMVVELDDNNIPRQRCDIAGMYDSPTEQQRFEITEQNVFVGFRPVLEPLPFIPKIDSQMLQSPVTVWNEGQRVSGILKAYTDYDLVLDLERELLRPELWDGIAVPLDGHKIIVDRKGISYLQANIK